MRFTTRKRRQAPAVIIISLIDILIVLLIFLMVTTTFKQFPAVKLTLPEARSPLKEGSSQNKEMLLVTVSKTAPFYYLNTRPVTLTKLQEELTAAASRSTNAMVAVRSDKEASVETFMSVIQAVNAAKIRSQISVFVQTPKP